MCATRSPLTILLLGWLLACAPELADSASPASGWPDLAHPSQGAWDGRSDAAVIVVLDEAEPGGRAGAWEVGSGWWRYLVLTRGVRPGRVIMVRNERATAKRILRSIEIAKRESSEGALLWFVFIGPGESPSEGGGGRLLTHEGVVELAEIREMLTVGYHESAFMLVDACTEQPSPGWRSGVPAVAMDSKLALRELARRRRQMQDTGGEAEHAQEPGSSSGAGLGGLAAALAAEGQASLAKLFKTPRNTFLLTSGTGPHCQTELAGRSWPALAWGALGGLQGWAERSGDGWVSATELSSYAQRLIRESNRSSTFADQSPITDPVATLEAAGVDLLLTHLISPEPDPLLASNRPNASVPELPAEGHELERSIEDVVFVPPGRFLMGCDKERDPLCETDEFPRHWVELGGFAIDRHEVTFGDYRECVEAGLCSGPFLRSCWVWTGPDDGLVWGAEIPEQMLADDHPVVCVSWAEAATYCNAVGKRLPTEAEWERAARGLDGRIFPWGDDEPDCARAVVDGCTEFTQPVGSKPTGASPVGALDMAGNVSEWVFDWWGKRSYRESQESNPTGPLRGEVRAIRGGSFYTGLSDSRASYRYGLDPLARTSLVGFRCAR